MKLIASMLLCLCLSVSVLTLAQAPIPRALKEAKTAYLVNDGARDGTFNDLAKELQKRGRFELVDDPANADITITLGGLIAFKGWPMTITTADEKKTPLYTDKKKKGLTDKVATSLVKNLRKHLEGKS